MSRLDEIRRTCDSATAGPWAWTDDKENEQFKIVTEYVTYAHDGESNRDWVATAYEPEDRDFIIHARDDIPWLLSEVERLTAENESLRCDIGMLKMGFAPHTGQPPTEIELRLHRTLTRNDPPAKPLQEPP